MALSWRGADIDVDQLLRFVTKTPERFAAVRASVQAMLDHDNATPAFTVLRDAASFIVVDAAVEDKDTYEELRFGAKEGAGAQHFDLLHGEALRFRAWADGACDVGVFGFDRLVHIDLCCGMLAYRHVPAAAVPRRSHGTCTPEQRCSHDEEFCLCRSYLNDEESALARKVYFRIFSIQADLGSKGTGVTVRVQRYYCTRPQPGIELQFGGRSSGVDATLFERRDTRGAA